MEHQEHICALEPLTHWLAGSLTHCFLPVRRLGGDERAQRRERRVDRVGAVPLPRVGGVPLAPLLERRGYRGSQPRRHGPHVQAAGPDDATDASAQLPLPVHLDVEGGRRRGGQAVGGRAGRAVGALVRAGALAAVLVLVLGEEGDVAVQEAAGGGGRRAQHGERHGWGRRRAGGGVCPQRWLVARVADGRLSARVKGHEPFAASPLQVSYLRAPVWCCRSR